MKHISLFSGIGGFDLAAEWMGWENISHTEWNEFGQKVLKYHWPNAQSHGDITKTDYTIYRGRVDILTGGFPCQDASKAKQDGEGQQGLQGSRTGLFWEMCRVINEVRPRYVVAENVENLLKTNNGQDFTTILSELSRLGYNAEWRVCRASDVGAPHHRSRLYIVAYSDSIRLQKGQTFFSNVYEKASQVAWELNGTSIQTFRAGKWSSDPPVLCLDDGFPYRVDGIAISKWRRESLKAYGNAVIPEMPFRIFKSIQNYELNPGNEEVILHDRKRT